MIRLLLLAGIACLSLAVTPRAVADDENHSDEALNASLKWVAQIDAGAYDESYDFGCDALKDKVPVDHWDKILKALRGQYGAVVSRKQVSHVFKPDGFDGVSGEFMVITYDTTFKKLPNAVEVIVLRRQGGDWRGAGYNAGPKPAANNNGSPMPASSSTEINTQDHVKPNGN